MADLKYRIVTPTKTALCNVIRTRPSCFFFNICERASKGTSHKRRNTLLHHPLTLQLLTAFSSLVFYLFYFFINFVGALFLLYIIINYCDL